MSARPDLDIGELLQHYDQFLHAGRGTFHVMPPLDESQRDLISVFPEAEEAILRVGWGPDLCSSSTVLVVLPEIIWDVNGWYRRLGVKPDATRRQLRQAYYALDGPSSPRLSYILKQLLTRKIRREYDLCRLGELYMKDQAVIDAIKREAARLASEHNARMHQQGVRDAMKTYADALDDLGYEQGGIADPEPDDPPEPKDDPWKYAFFRQGAWSTGKIMDAWQQALVRELSRRRIRSVFAVGSYRGPGAVRPVRHDGRLIFFLREGHKPGDSEAFLAVQAAVREGLVISAGRW